jgi:hypothetical protein
MLESICRTASLPICGQKCHSLGFLHEAFGAIGANGANKWHQLWLNDINSDKAVKFGKFSSKNTANSEFLKNARILR